LKKLPQISSCLFPKSADLLNVFHSRHICATTQRRQTCRGFMLEMSNCCRDPHWETMTQPPNEIFRCFRHAVYMAHVMSDERLRRCDCVQQVFRFGANMLRWSIPGIE